MTPELALADAGALEQVLAEQHGLVERALQGLPPISTSQAVERAARASLLAPAKRLRPILTLLVTELFRGEPLRVLPAAAAVEMIHTASLILDDLPCMDDAALRRGRPACHVAHGEATAVLAAFALINRAYEVLAEGWKGGPDAGVRAEIARRLAAAVGGDGMIAGQAEDLDRAGQSIDFATLEFIHSRKTGALFTAAASIGALAARAAPGEVAAVAAYAKNLGLAFQIVDDLIDVTGDVAVTGKDVGQDARKTTFVSFAGAPGAQVLAAELVATSERALEQFGPKARVLRDLARFVLMRRR
jgi:geranylgeranyl diphosphate synthase type II